VAGWTPEATPDVSYPTVERDGFGRGAALSFLSIAATVIVMLRREFSVNARGVRRTPAWIRESGETEIRGACSGYRLGQVEKSAASAGCGLGNRLIGWEHYRTFARVGRDMVGRYYEEWMQRIRLMEQLEPEHLQYDVVLNLGLLYHVTKQYELVKKTFDLTRKIGLIETITHKEPFSGFILGSGANISHGHAAGEICAELHPTYRALIDMMYMVGFKTVIQIEAEPAPDWHNYRNDVFGQKLRRCLVGIK